ncbi:MAG: HTH domain-containing protein [Myxococcaceae bacterium]
MTFYEAAIRVLESEGRPLHVAEITERSVVQGFLSHVGKTPEQTMLSRLAAMARRPRERRVMVTANETFALTDWGLSEDPEALAQVAASLENPEEALPPLRPVERHPEPRAENARGAGRSEKRFRDDDDSRGSRRRLAPIADVVTGLLGSETAALTAEQLLAGARGERQVSESLTPQALLTALLEDNQRRIDRGRKPLFRLTKESGLVTLLGDESVPTAELQSSFAEVLGIPMDGGRPALPERALDLVDTSESDPALLMAAKSSVKEARRHLAKVMRRRLLELDAGTFEKAVFKLLHGLGFREVKAVKRSKEGPLVVARRREGSLELRYAFRVLRGHVPVERRTVQDLRRDQGQQNAQVAVLVSAQDLRQEAKGEALNGGGLVMAWCGEALGEKFLEAKTGVRTQSLELFEMDAHFFEACRRDALESQRRREERAFERASHDEGPGAPSAPSADDAATTEGHMDESPEEDANGEGERPGESIAAGGPAAAADRKRRRRRRRGRRGRGPPRPGEAPASAGGEGASSSMESAPAAPASVPSASGPEPTAS